MEFISVLFSGKINLNCKTETAPLASALPLFLFYTQPGNVESKSIVILYFLKVWKQGLLYWPTGFCLVRKSPPALIDPLCVHVFDSDVSCLSAAWFEFSAISWLCCLFPRYLAAGSVTGGQGEPPEAVGHTGGGVRGEQRQAEHPTHDGGGSC